jgi:hypothetical protein
LGSGKLIHPNMALNRNTTYRNPKRIFSELESKGWQRGYYSNIFGLSYNE